MTALGVVRNRRGTLKNATLTQLLAEVDDVLNLGLVVSTANFSARRNISYRYAPYCLLGLFDTERNVMFL